MIDGDKVIAYIEERMKRHASTAWFEFAIWSELNDVKRLIEKLQEEEE